MSRGWRESHSSELVGRAALLQERLALGFGAGGRAEAERVLSRWSALYASAGPLALERRLAFDGYTAKSVVELLEKPSAWPDGLPLPGWARFLCDASRPDEPDVAWALETFAFDALEARAGKRLERLGPGALEQLRQALTDSLRQVMGTRRSVSGEELHELPWLARRAATTALQWVSTSVELVTRLDHDIGQLGALFPGHPALSKVEGLVVGLSDRHHGGRQSLLVDFGQLQRCVYKPKPIVAEQRWNELLAWLNCRGAPLELPTFVVWSRPRYGWSSFVEARPAESAEGVRRFYRRLGGLTALLWLLGGTDFHGDNLVAAGEHPIIVDLESLSSGSPREVLAPSAALELVRAVSGDSVASTGILPAWSTLGSSRWVDASALQGRAELGADAVVQASTGTPSVPLLAGAPVSFRDYALELEQGMLDLGHFVEREREALLAPTSPLARFRRLGFRHLVRPTTTYGRLLELQHTGACFASGLAAGLVLDQIGKPWCFSATRHPFWNVLHGELRALAEGDIPLFETVASQRTLTGEGSVVKGFFARSAFGATRRRIATLDAERLEVERRILRASLVPPVGPHANAARSGSVETGAALSAERALEAALRIEDRLARTAIVRAGAVSWVTLSAASGVPRVQGMSVDLSDGLAGMLLFFSAAHAVTGSKRSRRLAAACWRSLRQLSSAVLRFDAPLGGGAFSGMASVLAAAAWSAHLLDDPSLLAHAVEIASRAPESEPRDDSEDLVSGAAGRIAVYLLLARLAQRDALAERAVELGRRLLERRRTTEPGRRGGSSDGRVLPGISHGASGLALAFHRLARLSGEPAFAAAAREAVAYEDTLLREASSDEAGSELFGGSWCRGAAGIALARLELEDVRLDPLIRATTTVANGEVDHLCCGNFGRVVVLQHAGLRLQRPELVAAAGARAAAALSAATSGGPRSVWGRQFDDPSFLFGQAGAGYALLRLVAPQRLPCVLDAGGADH